MVCSSFWLFCRSGVLDDGLTIALRVVVATSRQVCRSRESDDEEYAILGPYSGHSWRLGHIVERPRPGVHWARVQGHRETCPAAREACLKRQQAASRCRVVSTLHACDAFFASSLLAGPLDDSPSSRRRSRSERWSWNIFDSPSIPLFPHHTISAPLTVLSLPSPAAFPAALPATVVLFFASLPAPPALPRFPQYLYTLCVTDAEKADKLTQSLPPGLQRKDIS